MDFGPRSRRP